MKQLKLLTVLTSISLCFITSCDNLTSNSSSSFSHLSSNQQTSSSTSSNQESISSSSTNENSSSSSSSSQTKQGTISIYSINDLHGKISKDDTYPGLASLQGAIHLDQYYDEETSIIVSTGDIYQGSYLSNYDKGLSVTNLLNNFTLSSMCLGNHEFDWGYSQIVKNIEAANFPFLCANLFYKSNNLRPSELQAYTIVESGDFKIGFVGAIGKLESSIKEEMIDDFIISSSLSHLREAYNSAKNDGADAVILLVHDDQDSSYVNAIQNSNIGFNGIFGGHSHQFQLDKSGNINYVQGGSDSYGYSYMVINKEDGSLIDINYKQITRNQNYDGYASNYLLALIKELENKVPIEYCGYVKGYWNKEKTANLVTKAMFEMAKIYFPNKNFTLDNLVAIHNSGGIRGSLPSSSTSREITMEDIQVVSPFDNKVMLLEDRPLDSYQLNFHYTYPKANQIDSSKKRSIITIDYLVTDRYAPNMFTPVGAINIIDPSTNQDLIIYDLLAEYIKTNSSVDNPIDANDF